MPRAPARSQRAQFEPHAAAMEAIAMDSPCAGEPAHDHQPEVLAPCLCLLDPAATLVQDLDAEAAVTVALGRDGESPAGET